ncbi:hypothetical protein M0R45_003723 [Rubus argutus]|uniref:ATP-dependent RNA helicase n=1 Tax=Rubus argutus TaxID=59490 RepID=A0AAW1YI69_RUBAR
MKWSSSCKNELEKPVLIGSSNEDYKLPAQLTQRYVKVPCNARLAVLLSILKHLFERETSEKIVLFFSTCDAVDFHYSLLNVAARGLDFPKVRCIIQYDSPGDATEYVHRVGRTARLGERGDSLLFLQPIEIDYLKELEKHGVSLAEKFVSIDAHPWVLALQKALESFTDQPNIKNLAKNAFCSWLCIERNNLPWWVSRSISKHRRGRGTKSRRGETKKRKFNRKT